MKLADLEVLDQNFYMGNNVDQQKNSKFTKVLKERKRYSSTKVKTKNFLTNISYKRLTKKKFTNKSFITDYFAFILCT